MTTFLAQIPIAFPFERLGWVLIHSLWQFAAIALVASLLGRVVGGRGGARMRYAIGLCGLAAITAAPVATWFFIPVTTTTNFEPAMHHTVVVSMDASVPVVQPDAAAVVPIVPSYQVNALPPARASLADAWSAGWTALALQLRPWLPVLVLFWLVGMSLCSLRPLVGWFALHRLRTVGVSAADPALEEAARRMAARLHMTQSVRVLRSALASTPMVVGYLRPVLLIPLAMVVQLPPLELEAIVAHELAHVRRHDFLVNLWQTALETVFFYHPAVWSLSHQLRSERENCCDDLALSILGDPVCYGRALLHVEELRGSEPLLALAATGGSLAGRIQRLFGQPEPPASAAGLLAGVLLPGLMLASVLAAFAWGAPEDNKKKQPVIADLIKQLSDPSQSIRDAAAAGLRKSFVPPPRAPWEEKVARVKEGMTRAEALAAIGFDKREPSSSLPDDIAEDYRLDEQWAVRLWLTRRVTPTTVTRAEILESMQDVWVNPPADFTGRWTTYFVNGQKRHVIDYRNGKYDGEFTTCHANGRPSVVQHYSEKHGAHGEDVGYYPSGKLSYRGRYFRGERIGTWTHFDENGQVRSSETLPIPPEALEVAAAPAEEKPMPARAPESKTDVASTVGLELAEKAAQVAKAELDALVEISEKNPGAVSPAELRQARLVYEKALAQVKETQAELSVAKVNAGEPPARSLNIVIAQHVIVWDGRIRTWDEVVTDLRAMRIAQGKPIHPNFHFTNGAHKAGHWDTYKAKVFEVYKELFEPAGVSLGGVSPRAGPRYDVLRKAEDLIPDPKTLRSGVVVEKGQPKAGVLVVLVPEEGQMPVVLKRDLTLRDPLDEVWTITGEDGRFTLPVQPVHAIDKLTEPPTYALAAITSTAYRLAKVPAEGVEATIELQPLAKVELMPVEGKVQQINLSFRGGLPDSSPGFSLYEIDLADKPLTLELPPGKITVLRSFPLQDGGSRSFPALSVELGPGGSQKVPLANITAEEAERKWIEDSVRPKRES